MSVRLDRPGAGWAAHGSRLADEVGAYTGVKDPVVNPVVAAAEDWAAATGRRP